MKLIKIGAWIWISTATAFSSTTFAAERIDLREVLEANQKAFLSYGVLQKLANIKTFPEVFHFVSKRNLRKHELEKIRQSNKSTSFVSPCLLLV